MLAFWSNPSAISVISGSCDATTLPAPSRTVVPEPRTVSKPFWTSSAVVRVTSRLAKASCDRYSGIVISG
jgi:hypothetical protein